MRDRLLTYALAASIAVHLALLGLVGGTSAARPIPVEQLKIVKVDVVGAPSGAVREAKADRTAAPNPRVESPPPEVPYIPPVKSMLTRDKLPRPSPPAHQTPPVSPPTAVPPGDPGGGLSGVGAPNGSDVGDPGAGRTPPGWVPGVPGGAGAGAGGGAGTGKPDPVPDARPGPGVEPVAPVAPPQPKIVTVTVCAVSGVRPGPYCEKKESRSFREGSEPRGVCAVCKAPEPKFVPKIADRRDPELERDCQPKIPPVDEPGEYVVKVRYTVNTDGSVSDVEIVDSCGIPAIDRAIREAASKLHYKPAVQNGEPRSVKVVRKYKISI